MRAVRAIRDVLEEDPLEKPRIILMPFNPAMNPSRESRVFCPPRLSRPAAISQYRWWAPLDLDNQTSATDHALVVYSAACNIYQEIMTHAAQLSDRRVLDTMKKEGFTFDVLRTPSSQVQLVEINPFGAIGGCGSCLFHWINDGRLLYGLESEVELRYTVLDESLHYHAGGEITVCQVEFIINCFTRTRFEFQGTLMDNIYIDFMLHGGHIPYSLRALCMHPV